MPLRVICATVGVDGGVVGVAPPVKMLENTMGTPAGGLLGKPA